MNPFLLIFINKGVYMELHITYISKNTFSNGQ